MKTFWEQCREDQSCHRLLHEAVALVYAEEGSILIPADDTSLRFTVCVSPVSNKLIGLTQPLNRGISGLVFTLQQPMIVNNVQGNPNWDSNIDRFVGVQTRSMLCVPLSAPDTEYGVVTMINSRQSEGFSENDLSTLVFLSLNIVHRLGEIAEKTRD
jgi:GAF domain-containing protein